MAQRRNAREAVVPTLGVLLTAMFGVPFLLFGWMALSSRFGGGGTDPHGYALIIGSALALVAGIVTALAVPLVFPRPRRRRAYLASILGYLVVTAILAVALVTA